MRFGVMIGLAALFASVGSVAVQAQAYPAMAPSAGTTYFNKPGADIATHDAAVRDCVATTVRAAGDASMLTDVLLRRTDRTNIENCMVVRGWRVYRLPEGRDGELPSGRAALSAEIAPWVGAENPPGVLVRYWIDDGSRAGSARIALSKLLAGRSLSVEATPIGNAAAKPTALENWPPSATIQKPPKPESLDSAPAGSATLVVTMIGNAPFTFMSFMRQSSQPGVASWKDGGATGFSIQPDVPAKKALKETGVFRRTVAYIVPPGRWAISSMGEAVTFCLGAPVVEVNAGEVVYLGAMDLTGTGPLSPDLSLDEPRAYLEGVAPATAQRLQPAAWFNGLVTPCVTGFMYRVDILGAPFLEPAPASPPPRR